MIKRILEEAVGPIIAMVASMYREEVRDVGRKIGAELLARVRSSETGVDNVAATNGLDMLDQLLGGIREGYGEAAPAPVAAGGRGVALDPEGERF